MVPNCSAQLSPEKLSRSVLFFNVTTEQHKHPDVTTSKESRVSFFFKMLSFSMH